MPRYYVHFPMNSYRDYTTDLPRLFKAQQQQQSQQ
jgi:hypothetical protein